MVNTSSIIWANLQTSVIDKAEAADDDSILDITADFLLDIITCGGKSCVESWTCDAAVDYVDENDEFIGSLEPVARYDVDNSQWSCSKMLADILDLSKKSAYSDAVFMVSFCNDSSSDHVYIHNGRYVPAIYDRDTDEIVLLT